MFRKTVLAATIPFLSVITSSHVLAAVIDADNHPQLLNGPHTNAILDTWTSRLWLDITETNFRPVSVIEGLMDAGEEFDGWQFPELSDVEELLLNANIPYPTAPPGATQGFLPGFNQPISDFLDVFGILGDSEFGGDTSEFFVRVNGPEPVIRIVFADGAGETISQHRAKIYISPPGFDYTDVLISGVGTALWRSIPSETTALPELLIASPPEAVEIINNVEITPGAEVDVTPGYAQASATLETILAVTSFGALTGLFTNEGEHLRDGIFVDAIHYNAHDITVDLLQAAPGDVNGDRQVDSTDIELILASNSFNNGSGFDWTQGDNNGDGLVDAVDIQNILATTLFGQPAYAALPGSVTVPEPSSLVLAVVALLSLLAHGHRRT